MELTPENEFLFEKIFSFLYKLFKGLRLFFDTLKEFPLLLMNFDGGSLYFGGVQRNSFCL